MSKKWLNATFLSFAGFASRSRSRAAKRAKYENLWVFIRSDALVVRAGLNIRALINPGAFRQTEEAFPPDTSGGKKLSSYIERVLILYMKHPAAWAR